MSERITCPHCGASQPRGPATCDGCGKPLAGGKSVARTGLKARGANSGVVVLIILSLIAALAGFVSLTQATAGVGGIAIAILLAVYARIAQAGAIHDRAEQHLQHISKQP